MSQPIKPTDPQWPKIKDTDLEHLPTRSPDGRYLYAYDVTNYDPADPEHTLGVTITDNAKLMQDLRRNAGKIIRHSESGSDVTN